MKKITQVNEYELPIEVNKEGSYYIAKCTWSDCYAQGFSGKCIDQLLMCEGTN